MIIQRYVLKEIIFTWAAVTLVFSLIYSIGLLVRFLAATSAGALQADVVIFLLGLKYISTIPVLLPLALYFSVIIGLGRLYKDSEMTAMASCGIGLSSISGIVFKMSIIVFAAILAISLYGSPWAERQMLTMRAKAEASAELSAIAAGRFKEIKSANLVFYTEKTSEDRKTMENVFVHREVNGVTQLMSAQKAFQKIDPDTGERFLVFVDGYLYEGTPGMADFKISHYQEHGVRIPPPDDGALKNLRTAALSTTLIWSSDKASDRAEIQWRIALPLSTIFLNLIAVVLSKANPRQGRFAKMFVAILVYTLYNNLIGLADKWYEHGVTPAFLGLWWVHVILLLVFTVMWANSLGFKWVWKRMTGKLALA